MNTQDIIQFLRSLSPGTLVTLQFDAFPAFITARFQGFQGGVALFSQFDGLAGLVRLSPSSINLISIP